MSIMLVLNSVEKTHIQADIVETYSPLDISRNPNKIFGGIKKTKKQLRVW